MTETMFDHDRLDVYRLAVEYTADSFSVAKTLVGLHRHARDQWLRSAQSIPLNIAEGNGKRSARDRARFFEVARGSALECAAVQDVLAASGGLDSESSLVLKRKLKRIVAMLTRMTMKLRGAADPQAECPAIVDYEHEHRFAEHEHEQGEEPV
jgi:four helix bundle protein